MPQMRTREFGKGMARRIDSEVREEDGVTATGDARRWCSRPVMRPVAGAERLSCQHFKSGAGRVLRWRPGKGDAGESSGRGVGDGALHGLRLGSYCCPPVGGKDDDGDFSPGEVLLKDKVLVAGDKGLEPAFSASSSNCPFAMLAQPISEAVRTSRPCRMRHRPRGMFSSSKILIRSRANRSWRNGGPLSRAQGATRISRSRSLQR